MEKNNLIISSMTLNDLEDIKNFLDSDFDDFWNYTTLKEELNSPFSKYIVAKTLDNNSIVGFAGIKVILDEADLMNIVTKKNMRNKRIASCMLEKIINDCKHSKLKYLNLEVNIKNTIAINLYKKYNFEEIGLRKKYYNNTDDAVLMKLNLLNF